MFFTAPNPLSEVPAEATAIRQHCRDPPDPKAQPQDLAPLSGDVRPMIENK
ncbi:hypothetical protein [Desulfotomaculum defluvii]